ncbi:MAG TPA: general secretion pathway protein GspB [Spongiibacteraceae bacterium]|nr:general secretion pathway protein GspB [Spongiibacteraceae bacterium]
MSLILDALKKSEQERRRDKGPDLQTIHQPPLPRAQRRSYAALLGFLLIAANTAIVVYWWQQRAAPAVAAVPPFSSTTGAALPAPAAAVRESAAATTPQPAEPSVNASTRPPVATVIPEYTSITPNSSAATVPSVSSSRIEEVDELPEDVRNNLPAMTFSFHVYSTNPQQRTIIINNRRMREGDEISAGLVLQEITEDGVILQYAQHRVHISVLSGW